MYQLAGGLGFGEAVAVFASVGVESGVLVLVSDAVPVSVSWSGCDACVLDWDEHPELDEDVVCSGHWCWLVYSNVVEGGENRVQEVFRDIG